MYMSAQNITILQPEDHYTLTAREFGMEGLIAIESVGSFTTIPRVGPIITVHDSIIYAGKGIGHHPHRYNERLFYLEQGTFDHDDSLNNIKGHIPEGAMARFTEGPGMMHQEWNNGKIDSHIFILVATTDPIPEKTSFEILQQDDMPITEDADGVSTRHMVGHDAPLPIYSDIHTFNDTTFAKQASIEWVVQPNEGGLLSVREGDFTINGTEVTEKSTVIVHPSDQQQTITITSTAEGRIIRTTFGTSSED